MKSLLFNLLAAVSLVFCVATVALWVRSYRQGIYGQRMTSVSRQGQTIVRWWQIIASRGGVRVNLLQMDSSAPSPRGGSSSSGWQWLQGPPQLELGGLPRFMHEPTTMPQPGHAYFLICPFWLIALGLAVPAAGWVLRRRTNPKHGMCPSCGYDLRATPERCPECGTVPTAATQVGKT